MQNKRVETVIIIITIIIVCALLLHKLYLYALPFGKTIRLYIRKISNFFELTHF